MKKITHLKSLSFLIAFLSVVSFGFGQIITFDFSGNIGDEISVVSNSNDANLASSTITRGSGLTANNNGNRFNAQNWALTNITNAVTGNNYMEFTVTPNTGYEFDITTININFQRSGTGVRGLSLRSSIDSYATDIDTEKVIIDNTNIQNFSFNVSQSNNNTPITFRFYGWSEATGGSGGFEGGGNDIEVNGSVSPLGSCTSVTSWNGTTWDNGTPDLTAVAIIDGSYTTNVTNGSFSTCSLTVTSGNSLTVADGYYVEVENDVTVNGNIIVQNHGAFVQNDDTSLFTIGTGTSVVRKSTSNLTDWYDYTYWSSPVTNETAGVALFTSDRRFWFNASNFLDVQQEVGNTNTFIAGSDDIDDNGDDWQLLSSATVLTPGVGYAASHTQIGFVSGNSYNYNFSGEFNNGIITTPISYNGANGDNDWNLIGNPYPCGLDFNAFYSANSSVIDGAAYLWSHRTALSGTTGGNEGQNFSQNDYAIITAGSGSINNSDNGDGIIPNDYIPSGQGFFIAGLSNGTVTFNNSMRMADGTSNSQFFKSTNSKKNSTSIANKLWVNLTSDNGVFNQVLVAYVDNATNSDDGMAYDAPRNLSSGLTSIIYTLIDNESDKKYAIQGKSANSISEEESISLGFFTSLETATLYTLSIAQLQGEFLTNNPIYLKDNLLNKVHDLTVCDYTFTSEIGEFNSRFEIVFNATSLSTENAVLDSKSLKIVDLDNDRVQFNVSENLSIKTINIYDLLGRQLYNLEGNGSSETYMLSNLNDAIYIAKVELSNGAIITKKAVKK